MSGGADGVGGVLGGEKNGRGDESAGQGDDSAGQSFFYIRPWPRGAQQVEVRWELGLGVGRGGLRRRH